MDKNTFIFLCFWLNPMAVTQGQTQELLLNSEAPQPSLKFICCELPTYEWLPSLKWCSVSTLQECNRVLVWSCKKPSCYTSECSFCYCLGQFWYINAQLLCQRTACPITSVSYPGLSLYGHKEENSALILTLCGLDGAFCLKIFQISRKFFFNCHCLN